MPLLRGIGWFRRCLCLCVALLLCAAFAQTSLAEEPVRFIAPKLDSNATPYDPEHPELLEEGQLYAKSAILINAKTQRVGVCNATEKLLLHKDLAESFLPKAAAALAAAGVEMHADERAYGIIEHAGIANAQLVHATDEDWDTEYLALKIGIKVVDSLDEAIAHINRHSTGHTESIIAEDYSAIEEFTARIDSAVVMVNASTRFTDGGVFGFGAELGISTQKMHARGPMGLREMTTTKWIGYGTGQVRE